MDLRRRCMPSGGCPTDGRTPSLSTARPRAAYTGRVQAPRRQQRPYSTSLSRCSKAAAHPPVRSPPIEAYDGSRRPKDRQAVSPNAALQPRSSSNSTEGLSGVVFRGERQRRGATTSLITEAELRASASILASASDRRETPRHGRTRSSCERVAPARARDQAQEPSSRAHVQLRQRQAIVNGERNKQGFWRAEIVAFCGSRAR